MGPNQSPGVSMPTQTRPSCQVFLKTYLTNCFVTPLPHQSTTVHLGTSTTTSHRNGSKSKAQRWWRPVWQSPTHYGLGRKGTETKPLSKKLAFHSKRKWKRTSYNNRAKPPSTTFAVPPPLCRSQSLPGPVLPGNKGKHWVGGGPTKNLSPASDNTFSHCCQLQNLSSCCQVQPCQETKENIGLVVAKKAHLPPLPAYQATGSTSSIHLNANQSKSSAIQLQTGVFSNFPIWTSVIVLECKYTSLSSKTPSIYKK